VVWKKISTGLSSPRKKTKTIPKAMIIVHLVSFATEADDMVVTGITLGAG
jgi:ribosomal protein L18E